MQQSFVCETNRSIWICLFDLGLGLAAVVVVRKDLIFYVLLKLQGISLIELKKKRFGTEE